MGFLLVRQLQATMVTALLLTCLGCKDVGSYSDFSTIEASMEDEGYIVFRVFYMSGSLSLLSDYSFKKVEKEGFNEYYLTFFMEQDDVSKVVPAVKRMSWPGIKLKVPLIGFNKERDRIYFVDKTGKFYLVPISTREHWLEKLNERNFDLSGEI